jgi:hypothetical protein
VEPRFEQSPIFQSFGSLVCALLQLAGIQLRLLLRIPPSVRYSQRPRASWFVILCMHDGIVLKWRCSCNLEFDSDTSYAHRTARIDRVTTRSLDVAHRSSKFRTFRWLVRLLFQSIIRASLAPTRGIICGFPHAAISNFSPHRLHLTRHLSSR